MSRQGPDRPANGPEADDAPGPTSSTDEVDDGPDQQTGVGGPGGQEPDGPDGDDLGEDGPGVDPAALARVAVHSRRPPRRTGVFLDPEDLRSHVGGLLRSVLGGYEVDAFGNFTFTHQDARVFVTIGDSPVGPHVGVFCVTNLDIELTEALATFLLTTNHTLGFGSFSYDMRNRAVWLRHTLLGTTLDLPELQTTVAAIATTAAQLDEEIRDRFGGRTFQDAPGDVQRGVEPPDPTRGREAGGTRGYL